MHTEAIRRERTEKGTLQVRAFGCDVDRSSDVADAEADLATFTGFQSLFDLLAL
jgi:hypothetical protein